jgi:hypothetical protein
MPILLVYQRGCGKDRQRGGQQDSRRRVAAEDCMAVAKSTESMRDHIEATVWPVLDFELKQLIKTCNIAPPHTPRQVTHVMENCCTTNIVYGGTSSELEI